ncbi:uncharacterized protein B0H18DRAFT_1081579 [Fomitopsis serialis]|uniref:uncharacterized protein n=1 Tax=Fomitopsis serialis TaxID=139415 RepID=UPI0020074556|nr:uncharacterized protein B0H18DRAFT_1081579 [Neoantrodia serialis]KAH9937380.1 hypothetical protein B0H18DRAFT_1081579 [Neoantrodia serialis]
MYLYLTGFSLNSVLSGLDLPTGPAGFTAQQIYNDKWDNDSEAVGPGEGEDWEAEVDKELEAEGSDRGGQVKMEAYCLRKISDFEKNQVLNFTELFKGHTTQRSRIREDRSKAVYPRKKETPRGFLAAVVGDTERQVENQRVEESCHLECEVDLWKALQVSLPLGRSNFLPLDDRSFDLVLLSNWEDNCYEPDADASLRRWRPPADLTAPQNKVLESGVWTRDRFNLSNDQYYEVNKDGGRHRVRQTLKLQLPFVLQDTLSKQEARSFHRPALQFPSNVEIHFAKVRTAKKKKDKAEEHPPIVSTSEWAASSQYYRKKSEKDEHVPKFDLGEPIVIEPQDESPFMKFGYVYPGQTVPSIYNNLVRAPLFRHKAYPTDFLVIRSTCKNDTKYYIREIKNLFVVGQTYPVTEVPGPHSRKITNTIKHRLQIIAFKLLAKSVEERLKISRLMKYFPDQNELQMRQRLKEFMEYHRRGPHQGFWRLKGTWTIPSDIDMLKMVSPEQVVLSESMQVGQRHLQDAGYSFNGEVAEDDEGNLSIEQQLAPWITTKNFLFATQAKAMLRLHGEGDPTGRGEAFSFVRVSMKDIFVKAGEDYEQKLAEAEAENRPKSAHRYNVAEQQQIYKSEIERIWKAQFDSLSRKDEPELTEEDEKRAEVKTQRKLSGPHDGYTPAGSPVAHRETPAPLSPTFSRGSSLVRDRELSLGPDAQRRVLRIKRLVDGEWKTEIIRDNAVITAYVKRRQALEEEATTADALAPTGDAEKDRRARKRLEEEIARMKKNQERRLHRKNAKIVKEGGTPMQLNRPLKPDTTRRCGHCGQMGHMKTNRKCPRWAEFNSGNPPLSTPAATSPPAASPSASGGFGFSSSSDSLFSPGASGSLRPPNPSLSLGGHGPSPLATSPPVMAMDEDDEVPSTPSLSNPKLKLTLKSHSIISSTWMCALSWLRPSASKRTAWLRVAILGSSLAHSLIRIYTAVLSWALRGSFRHKGPTGDHK